MNLHKNARLMAQGQLLLVQRVIEQGWTVGSAAGAAGLSQRQAYRWLARYRAGGTAALNDRSSAPKHRRHELPAARVAIDTKKLGRIAAVGHRITGDRRDTKRGAGWEAVRVCIDDASRLAYSARRSGPTSGGRPWEPGAPRRRAHRRVGPLARPLHHRPAARRPGPPAALHPTFSTDVPGFDRGHRSSVPTCDPPRPVRRDAPGALPATGTSRREASLRRPAGPVTLELERAPCSFT